MERRLAAILAADVVGYSRLMNEDEEGTLARLDAFTTEVIQPTIADHDGRLIKEMGDGFLCSIGYPFKPPGSKNKATHTVMLAERFMKELTNAQQKEKEYEA